jgi:hypothetical protein
LIGRDATPSNYIPKIHRTESAAEHSNAWGRNFAFLNVPVCDRISSIEGGKTTLAYAINRKRSDASALNALLSTLVNK